MTISTVDDIASALAVAQHRSFLKNFTTAKAAGSFESGWLATGTPPAGAAPPAYTAGSGYTADKSTTGALLLTNGAVQNYLALLNAGGSQAGTLIIADRLWSCSNMGFTNATYSVTTPGALPARITDTGASAELWVEQFAAAGAASGTLTCAYLDADAASQSGVIAAVVSGPVIGQMQQVPLVNNRGISQLTSVTNSATWTSGSWGMTILKRIAEIPMVNIGSAQSLDWAALALARIPADACLMFFLLAQTTSPATVIGSLDIIDK